jgi:hypothetical protein
VLWAAAMAAAHRRIMGSILTCSAAPVTLADYPKPPFVVAFFFVALTVLSNIPFSLHILWF